MRLFLGTLIIKVSDGDPIILRTEVKDEMAIREIETDTIRCGECDCIFDAVAGWLNAEYLASQLGRDQETPVCGDCAEKLLKETEPDYDTVFVPSNYSATDMFNYFTNGALVGLPERIIFQGFTYSRRNNKQVDVIKVLDAGYDQTFEIIYENVKCNWIVLTFGREEFLTIKLKAINYK